MTVSLPDGLPNGLGAVETAWSTDEQASGQAWSTGEKIAAVAAGAAVVGGLIWLATRKPSRRR